MQNNVQTQNQDIRLKGFELDAVDAGEQSVTITLGVGAASIVNWCLRLGSKSQDCRNPNMALAIAQRLNTVRQHFFEGAPLVDQHGEPICKYYTDQNGNEMKGSEMKRSAPVVVAPAPAQERAVG